MSYTKYGEFMRIQRIKHHEVMGDTAKLLDVKLPFISAVENGKRNVPEGWFDIIANHYNLSSDELSKLNEAIENSKTQVKIDLSQATNERRAMALQFQRSFDNLDDETVEKILEILNSGGNEN